MLKSKYITLDDYFDYFGEDLRHLMTSENPSKEAQAFLYRWENRVSSYINARFHRNVEMEYPRFTEYQKEHYKLALLEQVAYVIRNGDISTDSGYDPDKGEVMNIECLKALVIAPNSINELMLCGLWSRKINGTSRASANNWMWY